MRRVSKINQILMAKNDAKNAAYNPDRSTRASLAAGPSASACGHYLYTPQAGRHNSIITFFRLKGKVCHQPNPGGIIIPLARSTDADPRRDLTFAKTLGQDEEKRT